jgi:hypothetical protein
MTRHQYAIAVTAAQREIRRTHPTWPGSYALKLARQYVDKIARRAR